MFDRNFRRSQRGAIGILIALGILFILAGLAVVVLGAILVAFSLGAIFTIGTGWWLIIIGAILALVGVLL